MMSPCPFPFIIKGGSGYLSYNLKAINGPTRTKNQHKNSSVPQSSLGARYSILACNLVKKENRTTHTQSELSKASSRSCNFKSPTTQAIVYSSSTTTTTTTSSASSTLPVNKCMHHCTEEVHNSSRAGNDSSPFLFVMVLGVVKEKLFKRGEEF